MMVRKKLPCTSQCYVCGRDNPIGYRLTLYADGERVRARYRAEDTRQGYRGAVHGGVLSTLLDEAMAWAPSLLSGRLYVTAEITVRYIKPFPLGEEMFIEAWAEQTTRRLCYVRGEIKDAQGILYAAARGKYLPLNDRMEKEQARGLIYDPDTLPIPRS